MYFNMTISINLYRREKRDGRNPSTGAKTLSEAELKKIKMKAKNQG
jgi:hypothetical protein